MGEQIWLDVLGLRARVALGDDALASEVRRAWSACLRPPFDGQPDLTVEPGPMVDGRTLAAQLEHLTQTLTVTAIEAHAGERLMLHACAVADGERCVIFVGPSGMGKTTVARTLGRRWNYVTDECVALDERGRVLPFPKPLSVLTEGPVKTQRSPDDLGLAPAKAATVPVGLVLLKRDASASEPRTEEMSTVQAVALLAEHVSFLGHLHRPLAVLADLVHQAGGLRVVSYAEAAHLATLTEELLRGAA